MSSGIVAIFDSPGGGFSNPSGGLGGPGGGFRTGSSSGKPLLLPVLKEHPHDNPIHDQDHQSHHRD